jgi:flagellar motor switch protein FliN/FliY
VTPTILADSAPAIAAATVIENLLDGAIFSVGQPQPAAPDEILPADDARVVAVHVAGDDPTWIAIALTPALAQRLTQPGQELLDAVTPVLAAAVSGFEAAGLSPTSAPLELPAALLAGADVAERVVVGLLEGDSRVATLVVRQGPDAPVEEPEVSADPGAVVASHEFAPLGMAPANLAFSPVAGHALELLNDVEMGVTAELGRRRMTVRDLLALTPGSIIELDRAAGSPVDVLVNGTVIARGEVVVIDEEFGIRISEIVVDGEAVKRA